MDHRDPSPSPTEAPRSIGLGGAFSIVAGSMLGVGIFLSPPEMARAVGSPGVFLAIWLAAGLIVVGGAVTYAELGVRLPRAGGDYAFHREAFGPSVGFATGWALFGAIFSGSIAAVAVALFQFQISALTGVDLTAPGPGGVSWAQYLGVFLVLALTGLNAHGVRPSARTQQITTLVPLLALFVVAVAALVLWAGGRVPTPMSGPAGPVPTLGGLVTAYLAAYFAFSGWNAVVYVAGEVESPGRNIPRALLGGTGVVTVLYLVLCAAFIVVLGMGGLAAAGEAGSALAGVLGGPTLGMLMNVLILLCLLATLNASILGGARVAYAMGRDGAFLTRAGRLGRRTGAPVFALWLQGAWSSVLIFSNRFEELLLAVSLTMVVTGSLSVLALFALRRRRDVEPVPYRAAGYPWLPGLFLVSSAIVLAVQLDQAVRGDGDRSPLLGLGILTAAYAGHAIWRRARRARRQPEPPGWRDEDDSEPVPEAGL